MKSAESDLTSWSEAAPIAFGTALAYWRHQQFELWSFVAALTAMVSLHLAANLLNDVGDRARRYAGRGDTEGMGRLVQGMAQLSFAFGLLSVLALVVDVSWR